jgi:hypothetical protein
MERAAKHFLTLSLVTTVLGLIVSWIHDLAGGVVCGLGFLLLLLAFLCEKLSPKPARSWKDGQSTRKTSMGTMETPSTTLWVSNVASFDGKSEYAELGTMDGTYAIELEEKFTDDFCLVSKLHIRLEGGPEGRVQRKENAMVVDTGWLCFLTENGRASWPDKRLENHFVDELIKVGQSPLRLWLADENGNRVGFLVSAGDCDGVHEVKIGSVDGRIVSLAVQFM